MRRLDGTTQVSRKGGWDVAYLDVAEASEMDWLQLMDAVFAEWLTDADSEAYAALDDAN
jgi:hypothetical protein